MMEKRSGSFFPFMREKQNGRRVFQVEYSSICPSARSSSELKAFMDASVDGEGVERHDLRFLEQKAVKCLSDEQFLGK